jgi:hypothetical protein
MKEVFISLASYLIIDEERKLILSIRSKQGKLNKILSNKEVINLSSIIIWN